MAHKRDYFETVRQWVIPRLGAITNYIEHKTGADLYVRGETHRDQFVGRVPRSEEEFEQCLHDMGFERNILASLKTRGETDELEEGSFRKVGWDETDKQLHVILYDGSDIDNADVGYTYVYAHWEYRWDTNPIKHYRGVDFNGPRGVKKMKKLLDEHGVPYEPIRP